MIREIRTEVHAMFFKPKIRRIFSENGDWSKWCRMIGNSDIAVSSASFCMVPPDEDKSFDYSVIAGSVRRPSSGRALRGPVALPIRARRHRAFLFQRFKE